MSEQAARAIMAQQLSRSQRQLLTDDSIQNDGDLAGLRMQVHQLHQHYLDLAKRSN
jgi:dephospho-CoA kinase